MRPEAVKLATVGGDTDLSTDQGVFNNRAGGDDPKAMDKFEHGEKVCSAAGFLDTRAA